jgi:hypothetical protein
LPQQERLLAAGIYFVLLLLLARRLNGSFWPPYGLEGLWFYSAAAALLLGELVLEPFFTRPADALASAFAVLIASAATSWQGSSVPTSTLQTARLGLMIYAGIVILGAVLAIALKDKSDPSGYIARICSSGVGRFGRARWLFSALLLVSGYAAFSESASNSALLYASWFAIAALEPVESVIVWVGRFRHRLVALGGYVETLHDPSLVTVRFPTGSKPRLGDQVEFPTLANSGTVVDVTSIADEPRAKVAMAEPSPVPVGAKVTLVGNSASAPVIGLVSAGTTLEELVIATNPAAADLGLEEGCLVEAGVGGQPTLYQVVGGRVIEKQGRELSRHFVLVSARKLGTWNEERTCFEPVPWIASPGTAVRLLSPTPSQALHTDAIGVVPGTEYGIKIDVHRAVTHNTAILGVLGIGKTCLAWELMKRMLAAGVKVVVLDITGRYAREFEDLCSAGTEDAIAARIEREIAADVDNATVRDNEAGNFRSFCSALTTAIQEFADSDSRLLILNPDRFKVTRLSGNPFSGRANLLAQVTMVEVTRLIAENLLSSARAMPRAVDDDSARFCLVLEEAHSLIPEWNSAAGAAEQQAANGAARAILQGRKYGLGCVLITQRTANVTKSILNQCNTIFGMRAYDATGMGFLENYIGPTYAQLLASLRDRQAVVFGRASSCNSPIIANLNDAETFNREFWEPLRGTIPPTERGSANDGGGSTTHAEVSAVIPGETAVDDDEIPF